MAQIGDESGTRNDLSYAALLAFAGHSWPQRTHRHRMVVDAPLMLVSRFAVPTAPQEGHLVGGVRLMEFSGIQAGRSYHS
jgi:hypothetical protein